MDEIFQQLETRIRVLTQRCKHLERDNIGLRQNKETLAAKNQAAISQIEDIIFHLKSVGSAS